MKFVVKVSVEGYCVQVWLCRMGNIWEMNEHLDRATEFDSVPEAHQAIGEWYGLKEPWLLGFQVIYKGLCSPNPL